MKTPNTNSPQHERRWQFLDQRNTQTSLTGILRGIEKEGLRVAQPDCRLALTPHPSALGSALTNSWVTTDFSEALLEFITPVQRSVENTLDYLAAIHSLAAHSIGDEVIWNASMPCKLPADDQIPLAEYGSSNIAQMKTTYRRGLGHRYGRAMQTVAGIHYNFSLPDSYWQLEADHSGQPLNQTYINTRYLDLIRNFRRNYWLLIYLFGASPCADPTFAQGRSHNLQHANTGDLYLPYATSLRMGDLGYQSIAQKSLFICYNELNTYIKTLDRAMRNPYPPYNIFGLNKNGVFQQLSTSLLQIENEFYSPIRPKRVTQAGEKPLHALAERGVEYIEVRCIDISPNAALGIDENTIRFLDAFLIACLLMDSPPCDEDEFAQIGENQARVVNNGRHPDVKLFANGQEIPLTDQANRLLTTINTVAAALDKAHNTRDYTRAAEIQQSKVDNVAATPSGQLLDQLLQNNTTYVELINKQSSEFMNQHRQRLVNSELKSQLEQQAIDSIQQQRDIENSDTVPFDIFLKNYFSNS